MPLHEFKQGDVINKEGTILNQLSFITKGTAEATFFGKTVKFEKGDTIGICDLALGKHGRTYTAATDVAIASYPYENYASMEHIIRDNADIANLLVNSMCKQIYELMQYKTALKKESELAFETVNKLYPQYEELCRTYSITAKKIPGMVSLTPFSGVDRVEDWTRDYYLEIFGLDANIRKAFFYKKPMISAGFIRKASDDIQRVSQACLAYQNYLNNLMNNFVSSDEHDLFALISELHFHALSDGEADKVIEGLMSKFTGFMSLMTTVKQTVYQKRLAEYKGSLAERRAEHGTSGVSVGIKQTCPIQWISSSTIRDATRKRATSSFKRCANTRCCRTEAVRRTKRPAYAGKS